MSKSHKWNHEPIWARNEPATCVTCQAPFIRRHIRQKYCDPKCRHSVNTPEDKLLFERFENICQKFGLARCDLNRELFHTDQHMYYLLKNQKLQHAGAPGPLKKHRMMMTIKAFCDQMENGYWDLIVVKRKAVRRITPQQKYCPRRVPGCPGHFLPHYCPRNFKECLLA